MGCGKSLLARFSKYLIKLLKYGDYAEKGVQVSAKSIEDLINDDGDGNEDVISKDKFKLL